jgi:hypothetical protein
VYNLTITKSIAFNSLLAHMTVVTPGTNGTLKKATAEGQLLELITFLQLAEANTAKNPNARNFVSGTFNIDSLVFSGSFNFPVITTVLAGQISVGASEYLNNHGFTAGTGGTFISDNPAQHLLEIATFLQNREADTLFNPQGLNNISTTIDGDSGIFSGTISLNLEMLLTAEGKTEFSAKEYLG